MSSFKLDGKERLAVWGALGMAAIALILGIAGVSVGGKHAKSIDQLKRPEVLLAHDAAPRRGDLEYSGSLFRGSGFWAKRKDLPVAMADFGTVAYDDLIYIVGGVSGNGTVFNTLWLFDPLLHNLTKLAPMTSPRYRFGIALVGSKIYVVGGKESDPTPPLNSLSIYDILTNTWEDGPSASINRSDPCATSLNGKVYLVGGYDGAYNPLGTVEEYDPETKKWQTLPNLPTPRGDLMCAALISTGLVYALGGYFDITKPDSFSNKVEAFDPKKNAWVGVTDLLTPRGDAVALVLPGERIMVIGGEGHYRKNDKLKYPKHVNEIFYPEEAAWVEKAMIPTARFRLGGAVAGGLAYALGGAELCAISSYEEPCPVLTTVEVFLDVDHPDIFTFVKKQNARPSPVYPL